MPTILPRVTSHPLEVPLVLQDLPPAESMSQAFENLQQLNSHIDVVFGRITAKIQRDRSVIDTINNRIAAAHKMVVQISQNQQKACTVFSLAKYPASKNIKDYVRLDGELDAYMNRGNEFNYKMNGKLRSERATNVDTSGLFHEFMTAHAVRTEKTELEGASEEQEGLGRLPANLPSVSSILLFNSSENPYKSYSSFNNLEGVVGKERERTEAELAMAPTSVLEGAELPTFHGLQFEYKPELGVVPTFNFSANLPLAKLAGDINFSTNAATANAEYVSIAPSVVHLPTLPALTFEGLPAPSKQKQPISAVPVSKGSAAPATASSTTSSSASAPPPPAPSPAPSTTTAPLQPSLSSSNFAIAPPPPPPDLDDLLGDLDFGAPTTKIVVSAPKEKNLAPPVAASNDRGSLLEAIRNPKNKLKKVQRDANGDPIVDKPAASPAVEKKSGGAGAGGGGDMMSVLRDRLRQRQSAMSGKDMDAPSKPPPSSTEAPAARKFTLPRLGVSNPASDEPKVSADDDGASAPALGKPAGSLMDAIMARKKAPEPVSEDDEDDWNT